MVDEPYVGGAGDEAGMETFEDFGYEAEDFLDPIQVPDYEQSEAPVALTRPDMHDEARMLLATSTHRNGTLTTFADVPTVDDRVHRSRVAGRLRTLTVHAAEASTAAEVAARQERTEIQRLEYLRAQTTNCEAELEHLINVGAQKPNIAQQDKAQVRLSEAMATEVAQAEALEQAVGAARASEEKRDALLLELMHARHQHEALAPKTAAESAANHLAAPQRAAHEKRAAERIVNAQHAAEAAALAAEQTRRGEAARQLEAARVGHKRAVVQLRERVAAERKGDASIHDRRAEINDQRAAAVIALKNSAEAAASEMRSANARRAERLAIQAKQRQAEKAEILAKGANPYQVFRQRDEDARLARERKKMSAALEANMEQLQGRIVAQYRTEAREREQAAAHRAAIEEKAKAISSNGKEVANNKFMLENTKTHVTVLDPTSKLRHLHASEHMTVTSRPEWKFGLGMGADPDVIDHYAAKYPDVTAEEGAKAAKKEAAARALAAPSGGHRAKSTLPTPNAASVRLMASEAAARDEAVDELLEADAEGLWEDEVEGVATGGGRAKQSANPYGLRELTTLEKRYMAAARERQKPNQIVKQVVGGKTWEGPAFLAKPATLVFADFDVGQTYELVFTLTNVSYTFNSFRPQDLPDAVRSFFELTHKPPGRMSAGVTTPLTLTFTPKVNQDIESEILFHTATGPMTVPLQATTKKAKITLPSPSIDFGAVVMGEEKRMPLTIVNGGALDCPLTITTLHATQPEPEAAGEAAGGGEAGELPPLFTLPHGVESIVVKGYDTTTVMLTFSPRCAGDAATLFRLDFGPAAPAEEVSVHGLGMEVPIYLERELIDMQCCAFDGLYREAVVIHNRARVAHKVTLKVPPALRGFLEFVPAMGYVQAKASFTVSLKLRSSKDLLTRCAEHASADGVLNVPLTVGVPDQVLPVNFTLRAQLTTPALHLMREEQPITTLNFGICPLSATRCLTLTLVNPSALPQRFGFVPLPKGIDVQPGDGLGTVLPGETITRRVLFSPSAATMHQATLTCKTSLNKTWSLKCIGQGVLSPLALSTSRLAMPPTAEGDKSAGDVTLSNSSSAAQNFEFAPPEGSGLKLSPLVGTVQPGETIRILVEFTAPINPDSSYKPYGANGARVPGEEDEEDNEGEEGEEGAAEEGAAEEGGEPAAAEADDGEAAADDEGAPASAPATDPPPLLPGSVASGPGEPWTLLASPTVPCFVREEGKDVSQQATIYLGVETPVVAVPLVLGASGTVHQEVGFESVPVGQSRICPVQIVSRSDEPLQLSAIPLEELGPFSTINAMPVLPPRGTVEINVRFAPTRQLPGRETLKLSAAGCTLCVHLTGQGVSPTMRVIAPSPDPPPAGSKAPPPPADGAEGSAKVRLGGGKRCTLVHLADLLVGDEATKEVTVENTSEFALRYTLTLVAAGHSNVGPLPPFDVSPCEAEIAGGASQKLTVRFAPDHASDGFWQLVELSVPNQESEPQLLMLRGRGYSCAGYLLSPDQHSHAGSALLRSSPRDLVGLPAPAVGGTPTGDSGPDGRTVEILLVPTGEEGVGWPHSSTSAHARRRPGPSARAAAHAHAHARVFSLSQVGSASLVIGHAKANTLDVKPAPLEFSFEGLDDAAVRRPA